MTVAALYVQPRGCYTDLDGVDPWPEWRDAMLYGGPWPVVAHPPCSRWCRLAGLVEARWGHKKGDDGGTFAHALEMVRRWGGILEHPAYSDAWGAHGLNAPPATGGWVVADFDGGWTCHVEQARYGHRAKKATWLYACHVQLPDLRWGTRPAREYGSLVGWCANREGTGRDVGSATVAANGDARERIGKAAAAATPEPFRDMLIETARTARTWVRGVGAVGDAESGMSVELQSGRERNATPEPFRDMLIETARTARDLAPD